MSKTTEEPWTVLRLLEWTTNFFKTKGSTAARLDAEVLLAHARDCARIELYTSFGEVPDEEQLVAFREMVRRRAEGTPVAQLVGYREFYSLRFRVDDRVLIPRPETEHLVTEALDHIKSIDRDDTVHIADIGTGSGAIAIALAKNSKSCQITAVDQSADALEIAQWNVTKLDAQDRVQLHQSDLLLSVPQPEQFDLICSNPPYVSEAEWAELAPEVKDHEPKTALVSGPKGNELIQRLLDECGDRLKPSGRMLIELSPMIADECLQAAQHHDQWRDARLIKDLSGHQRILSVTRATE